MDKGYDLAPIYDACEDRNIRPIMPLRLTPAVKAGADEPPCCEHARWTFAGSDYKRFSPSSPAPSQGREPCP
jgi:hypothetical protein